MTENEQERLKDAKSRIPTFQTVEEEAAFWDTHSSEEFADELTSVENVKFVKARSKRDLTVRVDEDTFEELDREAREKGIGPSTLASMLILEHLQARRRAS
jgi:CopG antitoxin of type II toxin-antitoxin system